MYGKIKSLTRARLNPGIKPSLNVIKTKDGKTLTETEDILGRWKEYSNELYKGEEMEEEEGESLLTEEPTEDSLLTLLRSEVEHAMKDLGGS